MTDDVRVGARQWQVLGAIAQSPDQALSAKDLYVHMRYYAADAGLRKLIDGLDDAGLIAPGVNKEMIVLTERGATAKRQHNRYGVPYFCPLRTRSQSS